MLIFKILIILFSSHNKPIREDTNKSKKKERKLNRKKYLSGEPAKYPLRKDWINWKG